MSRAITQVESTMIPVMVRAYQDEPVKLRTTGRKIDSALEVAGEDADKKIGFPAECVYKLDSALFRKLRAAYEAGDPQRLAQLWDRAHRFGGTAA